MRATRRERTQNQPGGNSLGRSGAIIAERKRCHNQAIVHDAGGPRGIWPSFGNKRFFREVNEKVVFWTPVLLDLSRNALGIVYGDSRLFFRLYETSKGKSIAAIGSIISGFLLLTLTLDAIPPVHPPLIVCAHVNSCQLTETITHLFLLPVVKLF